MSCDYQKISEKVKEMVNLIEKNMGKQYVIGYLIGMVAMNVAYADKNEQENIMNQINLAIQKHKDIRKENQNVKEASV